uniref:Major facilitator superfamily (MFS) profile domain-containing protein n=1 Tax=Mycena chlorophos TaxID=658473 RepID=A0ABQ0L9E0_MYCCL|nr:predicted protein [Mycena chlorophos]
MTSHEPSTLDTTKLKGAEEKTDSDAAAAAESASSEHATGDATDTEGVAFSIYTTREKWFIVALIAYGGLFSPLTSNIYFPVIPTLSLVFDKSIELINLTVTMYIVFQAIAPMFWGTLADSWGRRLMFVACLVVLSLSCVGLALVPRDAYWLLLLLRCLQAAGSASTIALGAGVVGDIAESYERGGFFGVYNVGPLFGPAVGPVLGGALAGGLGWRAIFWFLCIASAFCAVVLLLLLPETLRSMVGNGSILPPRVCRPILPILGRKHPKFPPVPGTQKRQAFRNPLAILLNLDILLLLAFNGVICAIFYGVNASVSTIFHETYPQLNETELGLCYISIGSGTLIGSVVSGKILDWDYRRFSRKLLANAEPGTQAIDRDLFPIEKARMRLMPFLCIFYVAVCVGYGWCIERKVSIAGPLVLLFVIGIISMAFMNATQTLLLDLAPTQGSSITACNNLIRCGLSAVMVAVIQLIIDAIGVGWTYVLLSGLCIVASPLIWIVMFIGPKWRARRRRKAEEAAMAAAGH